jgi:hypothetical protein
MRSLMAAPEQQTPPIQSANEACAIAVARSLVEVTFSLSALDRIERSIRSRSRFGSRKILRRLFEHHCRLAEREASAMAAASRWGVARPRK